MEHVDGDAVTPDEIGVESERRRLAGPLGATDVALNRYRLAPGEGFPGGLHAHADQEEVFLVLSGEAVFETLDGEVVVAEGEAVRFGPGEFQTGRNGGDGELVALAIGAPRDSEDVRVPLSCPDCDHDDLRPTPGEAGVVLVCPECGGEHVPQGCPECGREMRVAPGETRRTVVVCPDCGTERPDPFG
jgi:uncharacterized cupin superfamily protein